MMMTSWVLAECQLISLLLAERWLTGRALAE